jgi:hypothetical protein
LLLVLLACRRHTSTFFRYFDSRSKDMVQSEPHSLYMWSMLTLNLANIQIIVMLEDFHVVRAVLGLFILGTSLFPFLFPKLSYHHNRCSYYNY